MMIMSYGLTPDDKGEYDYEDIKTIDLILHIVRNLLLIPSDPDPNSLHHNVYIYIIKYNNNNYNKQIHEKLIIELKNELVIDTICLICESLDTYKQPTWSILLLEIFSFLLNNNDTKIINVFNNLQKKEELSEKRRMKKEIDRKRIEEIERDDYLTDRMKKERIKNMKNEKVSQV